ncbi:hypothetical protein B0H16DRAFT_1727520 [Mycena metata]|uniref:Uncharacterized protein n=1 Tax=Mycena metata TaxID=1033252 RepID=A0AAD7IIF6_9AGAR|nr:hypothetical protein B0H16DRAFT_1727520 [Mycena metata]
MASKKIPEAYEKNAPRFDDEKPEELLEFLENMERMMALAETPAREKNAFVVRYAYRRPAEEWKRFESYKQVYAKFKKEILSNYPSAKDSERGSMRKLLKSLKNFENEDIAITDTDELMKLAPIPLFLEKLMPRFQEKILDSLETERRGQPAPAATANANANAADEEDKTLTLKQVLNEAKRLAQQRDRDIDFFQRKNSSSRRDMSPGPSDEQIKLSVVNMMDKMESIQVQKLSEMDQNQKKKLNELEQFYKSLPGRVPAKTSVIIAKRLAVTSFLTVLIVELISLAVH